MAILNLVIADTDELYMESMVSFLISNYSKRFQVHSFTKLLYLSNFLESLDKKADILLISPELYCSSFPQDKFKTILILSPGRWTDKIDDFEIVNKYQHGDKLVKQILRAFAEGNANEVMVTEGERKTKVAAVYSPAGGAGKTTVAVSCCLQCAAGGKNVFYLNLEQFSSTPCCFRCDSKETFSNLFFYLKERNKNLAIKIEAGRCMDENKIHYFTPADSAMELDDMQPEELQNLIRQLRGMNFYDAIFVDMSSHLNKQNLTILKDCDEIILVLAQDTYSCEKTKQFLREMNLLGIYETGNLTDKMVPVLNKYNGSFPEPSDEVIPGDREALLRLPFIQEMMSVQLLNQRIDLQNSFGSGIHQLNGRIFYGWENRYLINKKGGLDES